MEQRDFKGIWIPREIWLNKELTVTDRCLLAEINSLDGENHCFASNEYFAEFFGVSVPTITRSITKLKNMGFINTEMVTTKTGTQRIMWVTWGSNQNDERGVINLISIYNSDNNTKSISKDIDFTPDTPVTEKPKKKNLYQQCIDMINEFTNDGKLQELLIMYLDLVLEKYRHEGKTLYANQFKGMLNKLDQVCKDGKYGAIVQQSLDHQYVSFYPVDTYSKPKTYVPDTNKAPQHKAGQKARNEDGTLKEY